MLLLVPQCEINKVPLCPLYSARSKSTLYTERWHKDKRNNQTDKHYTARAGRGGKAEKTSRSTGVGKRAGERRTKR